MSDRMIFVVAFTTAVLVIAGAFALPELFFFELFKSVIYLVIAVMVFFGEDQYSYMLGMIAPLLWFILDILLGGFSSDLGVLADYFARKETPSLDTPLHGLALLTEALLVIVSARAWRKQVTERFLGKTFGISLVTSLVYIGILTGWYLSAFSSAGRMP
jgi:hypothetical protein